MPATLPVSYTSVEYIRKTCPEIGSLSNVTSELLSHCAGKAEAEINGRINKRYTLPISGDVPLLTVLSTDLAIYYVLSRRPLVGPQSKGDPWLQKFKEARDILDKVADGEVQLINSSGSAIAQNVSVMQFWSTTKDFKPTFDESAIEEWIVDNNKAIAAANKRTS
jgi:phage gp36-like protein